MYPKKKVERIIAANYKIIMSELGLKGWKINFHVYHSRSRELRKMKFDRSSYHNLHGISFISTNKTADVIIFYDQSKGARDALSTLYHELLHCFLYELSQLVTIRADHADAIEEKIVLRLEKIFMKKCSKI